MGNEDDSFLLVLFYWCILTQQRLAQSLEYELAALSYK